MAGASSLASGLHPSSSASRCEIPHSINTIRWGYEYIVGLGLSPRVDRSHISWGARLSEQKRPGVVKFPIWPSDLQRNAASIIWPKF